MKDWQPVGVPALLADWQAVPRRVGPIFLEDLAPRARAGLLLTLGGGCPAAAFEYAFREALTAGSGYGPAWMDTVRILAREKKKINVP